MRHARQNPHGGPRGQLERGDCGCGHGLSGQGKLAVLTRNRIRTVKVFPAMKFLDCCTRRAFAERLPLAPAPILAALSRGRPAGGLDFDHRRSIRHVHWWTGPAAFAPAGPQAHHRVRRGNLPDAPDQREHRPRQLQRRTHQPRLSRPGPGGRRWTPLQRVRRAVVILPRSAAALSCSSALRPSSSSA